jgi:phosphatidylserine decarboxylase
MDLPWTYLTLTVAPSLLFRLNPTWDEKMLFHVRRYEDHYDIQFSLLDWDKVSGNDFIGTSRIPLQELISDAPRPDATTGLYGAREDGKHDMKEFAVSVVSEHRFAPSLTDVFAFRVHSYPS